MNNTINKFQAKNKGRKFLLAIDTSSTSTHYLEKAAEIASVLNAQLAGLYIEDEDLLIAADLPFTKEICFHVAEKSLDLIQIERDMKLLSAKAKERLEEIANRWQINWSFQTVRGKVSGELNQAAQTADMLLFGMQVFRDLQNIHLNHEVIHSELPCLLFPDHISNGEDIVVFASNDKPLEIMLAPITDLVKSSRVIVICTPDIYSAKKADIDNYLQQAGAEYQVIVNDRPVNEWCFELLAHSRLKLMVVDKNTSFAKSKDFYLLIAAAKVSGLLV